MNYSITSKLRTHSWRSTAAKLDEAGGASEMKCDISLSLYNDNMAWLFVAGRERHASSRHQAASINGK